MILAVRLLYVSQLANISNRRYSHFKGFLRRSLICVESYISFADFSHKLSHICFLTTRYSSPT